ncbi:MAG: lysophospholipid acyltransferase family protein [Candidatus Babeliales bacterium]|jgi:1-acyl-sn-glycerol-3-phosphate acyltransferase|nr:MAG: 1-acyl-sn-glycerol-3-phosphate acyltransferase (1-AGPacyltransferase) (1-AGPAT) [candidate division TM6 bacterium GW2011_GWF2_36_6]
MKLIRSVIAYTLGAITMTITTIFCLPIAMLPARYRYDSRLYHKLISTCSRLLFFFGSVKYEIRGEENLLYFSKDPAIYIMNHTSSLDIPIVEVILKDQPKIWISKISYTKVPFFGFILKRMHVIANRESSMMLKRVISDVITLTQDKKRHLVLFPEGRRYDDGQIHDFFPGVTIFAEKLNRPVVPIAIYGFHKIFPKNRICLDYDFGVAKISIGKPIMRSSFATRDEFIKYVQDWFRVELEKLQKE